MKAKLMAIVVAFGLLFGSTAFAKDYTVQMLNSGKLGTFTFEPAYLHVQPGDTVTFKAKDPAHDSASYLVPDGAKGWKGEIGKDITVTFKKEGVYLYECKPHHMMGMLGVIQVGDATNLKAAKAAAKKMDAKLVMNKGRLDKLMKKVK